MHLALAPRRRLTALYGPAAPAVLAALDAALAARAAAGLVCSAYDPEEGAPELGVAPAPLTPAALVAQLGAMAGALAARGTPITSLWIVGGPLAVPLGSLPNPVPDSDGPIPTDLVYGLADQSSLMAQWPVGRTPDAEPPEPGLLAQLLRLVAAAHAVRPSGQARVVALSAARWAAVSARVLTEAGAGDALTLLSPPARLQGAALSGARVLYCNLHGVRGSDAWFGQAPGDTELTPALSASDLVGADLRGTAVISQACYGARLQARGEERALAPALLAAGAPAVVAAHGLTYGAPEPPPSDSDLLAQELIAGLLRPGARSGAALMAAQAAMLRARLLQRGQPDPDDVKTLLGFVLYGDPALQLS
jgi:hypothetical protein